MSRLEFIPSTLVKGCRLTYSNIRSYLRRVEYLLKLIFKKHGTNIGYKFSDDNTFSFWILYKFEYNRSKATFNDTFNLSGARYNSHHKPNLKVSKIKTKNEFQYS